MIVDEFDISKPITYRFNKCPIADFAKEFYLEEVMPAMCNGDYPALKCIHCNLVRTSNCSTDSMCDFTIVEDSNDDYLSKHLQYIDEKGFIRNK